MHDFWWNIFLMLYFIWLNFIAWLPLLLEILSNMCIVIICCPLWDVIDFEINHSFLFTPFLYMTKRSAQKCKYLKKNKKYYCYGPLAFKSQKVAYQCNQKLLHHCWHSNNQLNSYIHSYDTSDFRVSRTNATYRRFLGIPFSWSSGLDSLVILKNPNDCSWMLKNIWCSMHLGKDICLLKRFFFLSICRLYFI